MENHGTFGPALSRRLATTLICLVCDIVIFFITFTVSKGQLVNEQLIDLLHGQSSTSFPPVVRCAITPEMGFGGASTLVYGCQINFNIYYNIFIAVVSVGVLALTAATVVTLVYNCICFLPLGCLRRRWASLGGLFPEGVNTFANLYCNNDLFVFNFFKTHFDMHYSALAVKMILLQIKENGSVE